MYKEQTKRDWSIYFFLPTAQASFNLLFHAAVENDREAFNYLLDEGATPTLTNDRKTGVLQLLMKRNLITWAESCMRHVPCEDRRRWINRGQRNGWTPLMAAAENDCFAATLWLLQNGANVNAAMPETGWTAMHAASKKGHQDILDLLEVHGGNLQLQAKHRDFGVALKVADVAPSVTSSKTAPKKTVCENDCPDEQSYAFDNEGCSQPMLEEDSSEEEPKKKQEKKEEMEEEPKKKQEKKEEMEEEPKEKQEKKEEMEEEPKEKQEKKEEMEEERVVTSSSEEPKKKQEKKEEMEEGEKTITYVITSSQ
jgi:hypothetical protein